MFSHFLQRLFLISAPGGSEWILIVVAVLILFGGKKIPEFMRGIGRGMREFNDARNNVKKEFEDGMNEPTNVQQHILFAQAIRIRLSPLPDALLG